jgi:hypothetical protein
MWNILHSKISKFVILFFLVLSSIAACNQNSADIKSSKTQEEKILQWVDKLEYDKVVDHFIQSDDWITASTPYSILLLCDALIATGNRVSEFLKKNNQPDYISVFAESYSDFLLGDIEKARRKLRTLRKSKELKSKYFGGIGLLELSINTDDFQRLSVLIKELGDEKELRNKELNTTLPFYKIILAYNTQKFEEAKALLKSLKSNILVNDITLQSIVIEIMITENRLDEALSEIEKAESRFGNLQDLFLLKSRIINLREGTSKAQDYLEQKLSGYPYMWKLNLDLLFHKLSSEEIDDKSNTVDSILKIGHKVQSDHSTFLYICNSLFDFGYQSEASTLFNLFNQTFSSPNDFMLSNMFFAQFHFVTNDKKRFKDSYSEALKQSPNNLELQWFTYGMMREKGLIDEAVGKLKNILAWDPSNVVVLNELIEVSVLLEHWGDVIKYYNAISDSGRFVDQTQRDTLEQYYQKAVSMEK